MRGVAREGFFDNLDADVAAALGHALDVLGSLFGPMRDAAVKIDTRWTSFDVEILDYHQQMLDASPELYQPGTLARLRTCTASVRKRTKQQRPVCMQPAERAKASSTTSMSW